MNRQSSSSVVGKEWSMDRHSPDTHCQLIRQSGIISNGQLHPTTDIEPVAIGSNGCWYNISRGVRQGYVIAPQLCNFYLNCVVGLSIAEMPDGCIVRLAFKAEGGVLPCYMRGGEPSTKLTNAALLHADGLVQSNCDRSEVELMLNRFAVGWACVSMLHRDKAHLAANRVKDGAHGGM